MLVYVYMAPSAASQISWATSAGTLRTPADDTRVGSYHIPFWSTQLYGYRVLNLEQGNQQRGLVSAYS